MTDLRAAIAATRFGTGLSPSLPAPRGAADLLADLEGPDRAAVAFPQRGWAEGAALGRAMVRLRRDLRAGPDAALERRLDESGVALRDAEERDIARAVARGAAAPTGFRERLQWFWRDHFAVQARSPVMRGGLQGYAEDAIRPHLAGRFADLLFAAVTHPAMVLFLDQNGSVGPGSRIGLRRGRGMNENLAREILELHTLGAGGPYGQADVRQLAELLTGLAVRDGLEPHFRLDWVEPGPETVLGRTYGGDEAAAIRAVLEDLAAHPATIRHLSRKLAVHFVADDPDPGLVAAMEAAWRGAGGDLRAVYAAMLDHPAAWAPARTKVRRPVEFLAAAFRALDRPAAAMPGDRRALRLLVPRAMRDMGQNWIRPPGPQGWPEAGAAWITSATLAARIEWAMRAPVRTGPLPDPRRFARDALGPLLDERTRFAAEAAETRAEGVGLVLAAPAFQRR